MKKIFKYSIPSKTTSIISMPRSARVLKVDVQFNELFIWAIVEIDNPIIEREFYLVGTGDQLDITEPFVYHGTFIIDNGASVWHLFERL